MGDTRVAVVSGASSGIGAAIARVLHRDGWALALGARRVDRLGDLAAELGGNVNVGFLDVTDPGSVSEFCSALGRVDLLVNNAGGALGLEPVAEADEDAWLSMYQSNVLGTLRMTKSLLPKLLASGDGLVVNIGSVAGFEPYPGGAGYNAAKHALRALNDVLRMELVGKPVRVTEVDPGMVKTDFSVVRFRGDEERAGKVYEGVTPLTAADVAECVGFVASRPSHVDIDLLVLRPRDQARAYLVNRKT